MPRKAKPYRALQAENKRLRRALRAERSYWKHLLFCPECALFDVLRHQCPDAQGLRHEYLRRVGEVKNK